MNRRRIVDCFIGILLFAIGTSCSKKESFLIFSGVYNQLYIEAQPGFPEQKSVLLKQFDMSQEEFISLTTVKASELSEEKRSRLQSMRKELSLPSSLSLMQKVIPLQSVTDYMDNIYGGTIGGFISVSGDVKNIRTMHDIYWGLRLDYSGTKFKEDGAGYAVIRFYPTNVDHIIIPFSPELGGSTSGDWPFGGGGFTTSILGDGGIPEYKYDNLYYLPQKGAELYECTPEGKEILRSVFDGTKWTTSEGTVITRSDIKPTIQRTVSYKGYILTLRGETSEGVHLFTSDENVAKVLDMENYSKGEYRIIVDKSLIQ